VFCEILRFFFEIFCFLIVAAAGGAEGRTAGGRVGGSGWVAVGRYSDVIAYGGHFGANLRVWQWLLAEFGSVL
jgi:hypothetical protein